MTETDAPSRYTWLRWALVAVLLLAGLVLLLVLGPGSAPLVSTDDGGLFR